MSIEVQALSETAHRAYHITHLRRSNMPGVLNPCGGVTVTYKVSEKIKESGHPTMLVRYGLAVCREDDRYERAAGRELAMHRVDTFAKEGAKLFAPAVGEFQVDNAGKLDTLFDKVRVLKQIKGSILAMEPGQISPGAPESTDQTVAKILAEIAAFSVELRPVSVARMEFTGASALVLDIPPSLINAAGELAHSRFIHVSIVRSILIHARDVAINSKEISIDAYLDIGDALNPDLYPVLN